jgi:hypothetical protein
MKQPLNEFKRMQQLAGLLKENTFTPENIKQYLLGMVEEFSAGNDNEYPVGKKMEFKYESIEKEDIDNYGEEEVNTFKKAKEFLVKNGPVTINNRIDYTFSTKGKDIVMNWVEPNWDQLNENLEQAEENEIEVAFQVSPKMVPWNVIEKTYTESGLTGEEFFADVEDEFRSKFENKPVSRDEYYKFFTEQPNVGGQDDLYTMVNWINFTNPKLADELYNMI